METNELKSKKIKLGIKFLIGLGILLVTLWLNPFSYNDPTERTVVTQQDGDQKVVFTPGIFYAGLFAKEEPYPNQIGIQYKGDVENLSLIDNTVDIGRTAIAFLGGASATVTGIAQFGLPNDVKTMLEIHNTHKSIQGLVNRRLAPYTQECLSAAAQLLTPEEYYNGGKAQMAQNYLDQLKSGSYLLEIDKVSKYDSLEKTVRSEYIVRKQLDKNGIPKRKFSSIKEYGITVGDAQITKTVYEDRINTMLGKQIDANTAASVAKQQLMTAQQQAQTAKAQGEKKLIEVEYAKKVDQTNQVVAAETKVKLAEQYKFEQKMAAEAAEFAAKKTRIDADAEAYKNRQLVASGLTPWDKADFQLQERKAMWDAVGKTQWPTYYLVGGSDRKGDVLDALLVSKLATEDKK